ncbi:MAG: AAA family ATPase [Elusimicrobia bacterium]|nr:AAA family ATPase [Elusimicrobiota bacterium]
MVKNLRRSRILPIFLAASLLLSGPAGTGWAQTVGAAAHGAASAVGISAAAGAQVVALPQASVLPLAPVALPGALPLANPFPLSAPQTAPAASAQTAEALATALPQAAALAPAVERHPVIDLINRLQQAGVALPETIDSPADAAKLRAAAEALPAGGMRDTLVRLAVAVETPQGPARQVALDNIFENGVPPAAAAPQAVKPGLWERLAQSKLVPASLKRYAAARAEERRPKAQPVPADAYKVKTDRLRWTPDAAMLDQAAALPAPAKEVVGQDLALEALEFGLKMSGDGHNVIITGPDGSGRETATRRMLERIAPSMDTPPDLVAVTNLKQKEQPLVLELPAGTAASFKAGLNGLLSAFKKGLPALLGSGEAAAKKHEIRDAFQEAAAGAEAKFQEQVSQVKLANGKFGVMAKPQEDGEGHVTLVIAPTFNGEPLAKGDEKAKIEAGAFTAAEWEQAMKELPGVAQQVSQQYMQLARMIAAAGAQAQGAIVAIDAKTAAAAVHQLGAPLKALARPEAAHDDARHAELQKRAKLLMQEFEKTHGSKQVGPFLVVIRMAQTKEGTQPVPSLSKDGKPVGRETLMGMIFSGEMSEADWEKIQSEIETFVTEYRDGLKKLTEQLEKEHGALHAGDPPPTAAQAKASAYVDMLLADIAKNYQAFLPQREEGGNPLAALMAAKKGDPAEAYVVSVLAANQPGSGAPVIFERSPSFENLFGSVEGDGRVLMMPGAGMVKADAPGGPELKSGSYVKANGGFLVLNLMDVLREQGTWAALMRAVRAGQAEIAEGGAMGALVGANAKRHPVQAKVKVVLIGSTSLKMLLAEHDPDFARHFKAASQFESSMNMAVENIAGYLHFMRSMAETSTAGVLSMTRDAMVEVLQYAAKLAGSNEKLTARFRPLLDLMTEATYWARQAGHSEVTGSDVAAAIQKKLDFEGSARRHMQEMYSKDIFHIQTEGTAVGQTNALTVYGDFGLPTRATVTVKAGGSGVTALDDKAGLAGPFYKQGVAVLESFLDHVFAKERGLPFEVRVKKEQLYSQIDGDSSTSTNIYATLSALSGVPIKQSIAMTGSADQFGNVQPIGGVNYKIEGFYDIITAKLKAAGKSLDGTQGVIIPATNVPDLMLRADIAQAVKDGKFQLWAVTHVSQGIEILTGEAYSEIVRKIQLRADKVRGGGKSGASKPD